MLLIAQKLTVIEMLAVLLVLQQVLLLRMQLIQVKYTVLVAMIIIVI